MNTILRHSGLFAMWIAVSSALCGCTEELKEDRMDGTVVEACLPADTKTYIADPDGDSRYHVCWENGDAININGSNSSRLAKVSENARSASFLFPNAVLKYPYSAVYPAAAYKNASTISLPAVQKAKQGSFAQNALPMVTFASEGSLVFHHVCSVMKISLMPDTDTDKISHVEFRGNNDEQISGDFTVDYQKPSITPASLLKKDKSVRVKVDKALSAEGSTEVFIAVPAGTYQKGFTIKVVDVNGHFMTKSKTAATTLEAGKIISMPGFSFVPTGTDVSANIETPELVEIGTARQLVDFAEAYNAGDYAGMKLTVRLTADIEFDSNTSAAYESIGKDDGYNEPNRFNGKFDGNGKAIRNYTASSPIFGYIGDEGYVYDLTVDSSCSFEIECNNEDIDFASLAKENRGDISDCHSYAQIRVSGKNSMATRIAGLVYNISGGGVVCGCSYGGNMETSDNFTSAAAVFGGVIGMVGKSENLNSVILKDLSNSGNITFGKGTKINEMTVGGIIGHAADMESVSMTNCRNSGNILYPAENNAGESGRTSYAGGVAGFISGNNLSIIDCHNTATIMNGASASDTDIENARLCTGGLIGRLCAKGASKASIKDCTNTGGTVSAEGSGGYAGGIAGYVSSGIIYSCSAKGEVAGSLYVGGISGYLDAESSVSTSRYYGNCRAEGSGTPVPMMIAARTESGSDISYCYLGGSTQIASQTPQTVTSANYSDFVCGGDATLYNNRYWNGEDDASPSNPTVSGTVRDSEGKALCNVVVSDGFTSVLTGMDGEYALESDLSKTRFIFVSQPSGYRAATVDGLSTFYRELGKGDVLPDEEGVYSNVDFTLHKIESNPENYTIFFTADPQSRQSGAGHDKIAYHSLDCADDMFRDIKEYSSTISGSNVCGIMLGDIVHENMDLYVDFTDGLKGLDFPTYCVIGNHDNNTAAADDDSAAEYFEQYFGPRNYSLNLGRIHIVFLDNLIMTMNSSNVLKSYKQGLTDDIWAWLQSDLEFVDKSSTVMVCSHSPMFRLENGSERYASRNTSHGYDYADLFNSFKKVYAWAGHTHNMFNYVPEKSSRTCNVETHTLSRVTGSLWTNEWINDDGTPRGYVVAEINGEDVSWYFKPIKYQSDPVKNANLPEYQYHTVSGNKVYVNGKVMDESYQMRAYPRGTYDDDYVYVNVFMWDSEWGIPEFRSSDGSVTTMTRVSEETRKYDLVSFNIYDYYKNNNATLMANGDYSYDQIVYHMFRCASSKKTDRGTVSVTDRFGNRYSTTVSW